jgi:hypothetical protein
VLDISTQEHFEVLSDVMKDEELEALRENRILERAAAAPLDPGHKRKKELLIGRSVLQPFHTVSVPLQSK